MWRKIKKVLIIFMFVFLFFRVFHWDTWNANPITYVEFEEKLLAEKYEKIVVNTKTNKVLLYEKESNAIDKFDLISKEKVEELVLDVKKVDEDLAYKVSNRKAGVFLFSVICGILC